MPFAGTKQGLELRLRSGRTGGWTALWATAWALAPLTASAELVDRVAAVVNRDIVTLSEVQQAAAPELQRTKTNAVERQEVMKRTLERLIGDKLLESQIRELNLEVTDQELELGIEDVKRQNGVDGDQFEALLRQEGYSLASYKQFMRKHLAKMKLLNLKVRSKVKVSDDDLRAEYEKTARLDSEDAEVHARHLLVQLTPKATPEEVEAARQKAVALMDEAKKPGVDFAQLAKEKSEGPSAKDGGDLGFFRRGVMVPEFERAAFSLPVGGVSEPVRTKFGWHVLKVEERRAVTPEGFEQVKEQLREKLLRNQLEKYTDQYVQELRQNAAVEVKL